MKNLCNIAFMLAFLVAYPTFAQDTAPDLTFDDVLTGPNAAAEVSSPPASVSVGNDSLFSPPPAAVVDIAAAPVLEPAPAVMPSQTSAAPELFSPSGATPIPLNTAADPTTVSTDRFNDGSNGSGMFSGLLETLFGTSGLPVPEGSLADQAKDPPRTIAAPPPPPATVVQPQPAAPVTVVQAPPPPEPIPTPPPVIEPIAPIIPITPIAAIRVVDSFDIAGAKLRMTPSDVKAALAASGYTVTQQDREVVDVQRWALEQQCMDAGVFLMQEKQACIRKKAARTGDYFINRIEFKHLATNEKMAAYFTSPHGGNKAFRITYEKPGDASLGDSAPSLHVKRKRMIEFEQTLFKKYGHPPTPQSMTWSAGADSPFLRAYATGGNVNLRLVLESPAMVREDAMSIKRWDSQQVAVTNFNL